MVQNILAYGCGRCFSVSSVFIVDFEKVIALFDFDSLNFVKMPRKDIFGKRFLCLQHYFPSIHAQDEHLHNQPPDGFYKKAFL